MSGRLFNSASSDLSSNCFSFSSASVVPDKSNGSTSCGFSLSPDCYHGKRIRRHPFSRGRRSCCSSEPLNSTISTPVNVAASSAPRPAAASATPYWFGASFSSSFEQEIARKAVEGTVMPGYANSQPEDVKGDKIKNSSVGSVEIPRPVSESPLQLTTVSRFLKGIPQNPHFLHLRRYSELTQKNLISGWDRTFEETVEQLQALRADNFWVNAGKLWKTMEDLQSLGYNVILLRRRLVELSEVMMELRLFKSEVLELKEKAEFHRMEKSRLGSLILSLKAKAEREQASRDGILDQVEKMEEELPVFAGNLANFALKPL
ncbi:uncharacterized protein LOC131166995 [Malania oleifera]|uniref:uncharacterized protein LOC131166995 n=1 Tax=Malania oleifera TaxID=397392 RepID=UPI0025AE43DF|nr:uncharacterized protein LOC131166995 [Malania oleifera]